MKLYRLLQDNVLLIQDTVGDVRTAGRCARFHSIRREVDVPNNGAREGKKYDLWGWLLFVVSALFFIASSIRNGDVIGLLGGVFFLLACVVFLASYVGIRKG